MELRPPRSGEVASCNWAIPSGPVGFSSSAWRSFEVPVQIHELLRDPEILDDFVTEAHERLDAAAEHAMGIEREPGVTEPYRRLRQELHTLKGSAGWVGLDEVSDVCHELEDLLDRNDPGEVADLILEMLDALQARIDAIDTVVRAGRDPADDPKIDALRLRVRAG